MSRKLRWGIIGIGNIVQGTMAPAILAEPDMELVAAVSRDQGRAEAFGARFGVPHVYTDYAEMLANPEVDAVFIATPNALHAKEVLEAAAAGKHILCDKPMAITVPDAVKEVEACRAAGVSFGINLHNRHLPWVRDTRQLIADGAIGDVLTIQVMASSGVNSASSRAAWRTDPAIAGLGTLYNVGVHVLDFLRYILDSEPVDVVAHFDDDQGRSPVDMQALVMLRFANGARAMVDINQITPYPQNDIAIYGSAGTISGVSLTRSRVDGMLKVRTADGETQTPYPSPGAHRRCIAAFTRAVLDGRQPDPSGEDGLRSMVLCEAIATSVRESRVVEVQA
jgi:1,5-anhydro-D-fructose reductase (1,5-anhydro-D-mannitol-forming)